MKSNSTLFQISSFLEYELTINFVHYGESSTGFKF